MSTSRRRLVPVLAAGVLTLLAGLPALGATPPVPALPAPALPAPVLPAPAADPPVLTWSEPARVTPRAGSSLSALHELAAGAGRLHLVHARMGPGARDDQVSYQRSSTRGATWSREVALFRSTDADRIVIPNLAVAAAGDAVLVAWRTRGPRGGGLWVRRSADGGTTWQPRVRVASADGQRDLGTPALALSDGTAIVAWTDRAAGRVLFRRSTDGGASFGPPRLAGRSRLSIDCSAPRLDGLVGLAASGDTVHLAWSDAPAGACVATRLLVRTSRDSGARWEGPRLASHQHTFGWPELTARGRVLLAGLQTPGGAIVVVRSADGGRTFTERVFRTDADRALGAADLVLPWGSAAWLVYADVAYRGDSVRSSGIRIKVSADQGRTWARSRAVVPSARRLREAANIVALAGRPVVLFSDARTDGSRPGILGVRAR